MTVPEIHTHQSRVGCSTATARGAVRARGRHRRQTRAKERDQPTCDQHAYRTSYNFSNYYVVPNEVVTGRAFRGVSVTIFLY